MNILVGYANDWFGQAGRKYQIVDETVSGKYVCRGCPRIDLNAYGQKIIADSMTGLFLRDKDEFTDVHEEELIV